MSDDSNTLPTLCHDKQCACQRDQSQLTQQLLQSEDPHVRILAHLSSRQLAMVESINNVYLSHQGLIQAINSLREAVKSQSNRFDRAFEEVNERLDVAFQSLGVVEVRIDEEPLPTGSLPPEQ